MNCNCIKSIEEKITTLKFKDKPIQKAKLISSVLLFGKNKLTTVTCSTFELEVEGFKRPQRQDMVHSFCPFCGTKIDKDGAE